MATLKIRDGNDEEIERGLAPAPTWTAAMLARTSAGDPVLHEEVKGAEPKPEPEPRAAATPAKAKKSK